MSINVSKIPDWGSPVTHKAELKPRLGFEEILSIITTLRTIMTTHVSWTLKFRHIAQTDEVFLTIMAAEKSGPFRALSHIRCSVMTMDVLKEHDKLPAGVNLATKIVNPLEPCALFVSSDTQK